MSDPILCIMCGNLFVCRTDCFRERTVSSCRFRSQKGFSIMENQEPSIMQDIENLNRKSLEALVVDNPDLERLEQLLGQFNVFEAIGAVRHELRH
jgi:hypothetical protein